MVVYVQDLCTGAYHQHINTQAVESFEV